MERQEQSKKQSVALLSLYSRRKIGVRVRYNQAYFTKAFATMRVFPPKHYRLKLNKPDMSGCHLLAEEVAGLNYPKSKDYAFQIRKRKIF